MTEEITLKPKLLREFIGQEKVKETLSIYLEAAKTQKKPMNHILLYGPPGLGKTTLAGIIANEMGVGFRMTSGSALKKQDDLVALLKDLHDGDILLIDEIHRLSKDMEETLCHAMKDRAIDLPKFTLVGATTKEDGLSDSVRSRFVHHLRLELYTPEELSEIITRSANILGIKLDPDSALELATHSEGIPRIANRLLKRIGREMMEIENNILVRYEGDDKEVIIPEGIKVIGEEAFAFCTSLVSITIPDSVIQIEPCAFLNCNHLTNLILPNRLTQIGREAFAQCDSLTKVIIPDSVLEIGEKAFGSCDNLNDIFVDPNNPVYASKDNILFNKELSKIICYPTARQGVYCIPDSVEEISASAFWACTGLTDIEIPKSVVKIGEGAFLYCIGLTSIVIPDSVTEIGKSAFHACKNLTEITIPGSVTKMGSHVFYSCNNLFEKLCREGLRYRYGENPDTAVIQRLEHEMTVIRKMGYIDSLLTLWNAIRYAKANTIPIGPGCGSSPGSLCVYCLGITDVDPIKYNLLFERFLNLKDDRVPTFDMDVEPSAQQKMMDYFIAPTAVDDHTFLYNISGLHCLWEIAEAERMIRQTKPEFCMENIPLNAPEVYQMLSNGDIDGIFQLDSQEARSDMSDMKRILKGLQPDDFEHLIALTAMYRPGPMDSIPTYIENRHHPECVEYLTPKLKSILDVTYGGIVYQEQFMQIFAQLAGYSLDRADLARRTLARRKHNDVVHERNIFIHGLKENDGTVIVEGCLRRGLDEVTANVIFDHMVSGASYALCKAHFAAYALLTYRTAYLKCFYPKAWAAARTK